MQGSATCPVFLIGILIGVQEPSSNSNFKPPTAGIEIECEV